MKFIKTFEELNLGTYANAMDNTENYPTAGFMASGDAKKHANKMARVNGIANARFQEEFFKLYPKVETKIYKCIDCDKNISKKQMRYVMIVYWYYFSQKKQLRKT